MSPPTVRFAPSPNGHLHLGHAFAALTAYAEAKRLGARFLVRIEDIDTSRCRPEFEASILDDLAWLGLEWDEPVRRQSEHFAEYRAALDALQVRDLVYPSFAGRAEIARAVAAREAETGTPWPRDPDGAPLYPHLDRRQGTGRPSWRLDTGRACAEAGPLTWREQGAGPDGETGTIAAHPQAWGDVVLARKETPTSYHLSVVLDDATQGVTHVVRGHDLFHATGVHRLLQALLGLAEPTYRHHELVIGEHGRKLSKSAGSTSLRQLRRAGATRSEIVDAAGFSNSV